MPLVAALAVTACSGMTDPPAANSLTRFGSLDGKWSGSVGIVEYDAQLVQQGFQLGGTGAIGPTPGSGAEFATRLTTITGTAHSPQVNFEFVTRSGGDLFFTGTQVSVNVITGTIQGPTAAGEPLTLSRH